MKILLIISECNPEWPSVPLLGYNFYYHISKLVDVTLATHGRNKTALEKRHAEDDIIYFQESRLSGAYYRFLNLVGLKRWANWPLQHMFMYPFYAEFNHNVDAYFNRQVSAGQFDVVHALTPILPRYPVKIVSSCHKTPFLLGPVNGGLPFPKNFNEIAREEKAHFNFLRLFSRVIPGYSKTYKTADKVLSGSSFTLKMLRQMFPIAQNKIELFSENGIEKEFLKPRPVKKDSDQLRLLFVGRLVPYKGADMILSAVSELNMLYNGKIRLTIVGDGSERDRLHRMTRSLQIENIVHFTGWISQRETMHYYENSDVFCFPSVREFGGAVVLEAMAFGLPCIVANHGGISEYLTEETGFKISPISKGFIIEELKNSVTQLINDKDLYQKLSFNSVERARSYEWGNKAKKMVEIYHNLINAHRTE